INVCITGEIEDSLYIKRSGASVSDVIFVTGTLGDSAMGLEILRKSQKSEIRSQKSGDRRETSKNHKILGCSIWGSNEEFLIRRHLMPQPRIKEGRTIALNRLATSMIDISDGLSSDLWHICEESGVGAEIYSTSIPLSDELREIAEKSGCNPIWYALNGGEDYELLFTAPEGLAGEVTKRLSATIIGKILPVDAGVTIVDSKGKRNKLMAGGYDHFKKS
ncbi:MAG: thiamine-phosphate kinase, partial [Nitrospirota bacterium]